MELEPRQVGERGARNGGSHHARENSGVHSRRVAKLQGDCMELMALDSITPVQYARITHSVNTTCAVS